MTVGELQRILSRFDPGEEVVVEADIYDYRDIDDIDMDYHINAVAIDLKENKK